MLPLSQVGRLLRVHWRAKGGRRELRAVVAHEAFVALARVDVGADLEWEQREEVSSEKAKKLSGQTATHPLSRALPVLGVRRAPSEALQRNQTDASLIHADLQEEKHSINKGGYRDFFTSPCSFMES